MDGGRRERAGFPPRFYALDAQIHFLSCVVGLGRWAMTLRARSPRWCWAGFARRTVETALDLGLGDWSMPKGMGFWDIGMTASELNHANAIYPVDRQDAEVAELGTIRIASASGSGANLNWATGAVPNTQFMLTGFDSEPALPSRRLRLFWWLGLRSATTVREAAVAGWPALRSWSAFRGPRSAYRPGKESNKHALESPPRLC